jgi:hypothetical protein
MVGEEERLDLAISCIQSLSTLGFRRSRPAMDALCSQMVSGGARLPRRQLVALLRACAACAYKPPRVMRRLARAAAAVPAGEWGAGDAAAAARAFGELRRWEPGALGAIAAGALAAAGAGGGGGGRPRKGPTQRGAGGIAAAGAAGCLADVVWGCAAALQGAGGLERLARGGARGREPPRLPPAVVAACSAATDAAVAAAPAPESAGAANGPAAPAAARGLAPRQQADLIWGLRRLGRAELARRVLDAYVGQGGAERHKGLPGGDGQTAAQPPGLAGDEASDGDADLPPSFD